MRGLGFIFALLIVLMVGALGARADGLPSVLARPIFARVLFGTAEGREIRAIIWGGRGSLAERELGLILRALRHPDNQALALDLAARTSEIEAVVDSLPAREQEAALRQLARRELRVLPASEGALRFRGGERHPLNTVANLEFTAWKETPAVETRFIEGDSRLRDQNLTQAWGDASRPRLATATLRARCIRVMELACESVASAEQEVLGIRARQGWPRNPSEVLVSLRLAERASVDGLFPRVFAPADWNRHERLVTQYRGALRRLPTLVAELENLR